jgi:hypothetical protein
MGRWCGFARIEAWHRMVHANRAASARIAARELLAPLITLSALGPFHSTNALTRHVDQYQRPEKNIANSASRPSRRCMIAAIEAASCRKHARHRDDLIRWIGVLHVKGPV